MTRYRYGVYFVFQGAGKVYRFDYSTTILVLFTGSLMLGIARTIADLVAANLFKCQPGARLSKYPTSKVLRNKRFEAVSSKRELAAQVTSV